MALFLALVLILGSVLRVPLLDRVPPELFGDEVDVGYQAVSLFKTGRDLYGQVLPTYIHSLSEWRMPLLMYATVPTVALWGNTAWGVRLPSSVWGILAPLILAGLTYHLSRSKLASILAAVSLTTMPWHIQYSRAAFEAVVLLDLVMLGTWLFLKKKDLLSGLFFALSLYTYSTAVLFVPLWVGSLWVLARRRAVKQLAVLVVLGLPLMYQIWAGPARERFGLLSLARDPQIRDTVVSLRRENGRPEEVVFHNKVEAYLNLWVSNYLRAFSPEFLFIRGDPIYRHSIQIVGQLFWATVPLVVIGIYQLARQRHFLWLVWLVLAPVPAALTVDGANHATRLFLMIPPLAAAAAEGWVTLARRWYKLAALGVGVVLVWQLIWAGHYYLVHYPAKSWVWWHMGYRDMMQAVARYAPDYSRVFVNNSYEPSLIRFLFWAGYSPEQFHKRFVSDKPQEDIVPGYDGFSLDGKYYFGSFTAAAGRLGIANYFLPGGAYVVSQRDDVGGDWDWRTSPPEGVKVLHTSVSPAGEPVLYLVTKK